MAVPPYKRQADFTSYEVENPTVPKRGTDLDAEFDAAALATVLLSQALTKIQRDDGKLRNLSVHPDALSEAVRALVLLQGADMRGGWLPATDYRVGDVLQAPNGDTVIAHTAHTSGVDWEADYPRYWLLIEGAGLTRVRYWEFVGDGVTTEFLIPGADVSDPTFYDVVVGGVLQSPEDAFDIEVAPDTDGSKLVLAAPPADGVNGWVILRGLPQPAPINWIENLINNQEFLEFLESLITNTLYETTNILRLGPMRSLIPMTDATGDLLVTGEHESHLIRTTGGAPSVLTIRANTGDEDLDWDANPIAAPYFSVVQRGTGEVTVIGQEGVTITTPQGYLPKPRTEGSVITFTGDYVAGGEWICSGDMALA